MSKDVVNFQWWWNFFDDEETLAAGQPIAWWFPDDDDLQNKNELSSTYADLIRYQVLPYLDEVLEGSLYMASNLNEANLRFVDGNAGSDATGDYSNPKNDQVNVATITLDEEFILSEGVSDDDNFKFFNALHELGHALGLGHPFSNSYINAHEEIDTEPLINEWGSQKYSIMEYNLNGHGHPSFQGSEDGDGAFYPTTFMLHDYLTLKNKGWLNDDYDSEDTFYFDEDGKYLETIYEGRNVDSIDTIDASGHTTSSVTLDLRQGHFSSVGSDGSGTGRAVENVAIAYGTVIENAIGGSGDDILIGNVSDNKLEGGDGDDVLYGDGASTSLHLKGNDSEDEKSGWWEGADPSGNESGNDTLIGGAGNDTLVGGQGNDVLKGGADDDTYIFNMDDTDDLHMGIDRIEDSEGDNTLRLDNITIGTLKSDATDSNIYRDENNEDFVFFLEDSLLRVLRVSTGEIIEINGFDKDTNNFGLTFEDFEEPTIAAPTSSYNTTTSLGNYDPTGDATTRALYLDPTRLDTFDSLRNASTDSASQDYQIRELLKAEFGTPTFPGLDKSISYDAANYVPYKWSANDYQVISTADLASYMTNHNEGVDYFGAPHNLNNGNTLLYKTPYAANGIDSRVFEGSNKNDLLKGKDWSDQFNAMHAWDTNETDGANHQFSGTSQNPTEWNGFRDKLFGLEGDDVIIGDGMNGAVPEQTGGDNDLLVGGQGNDTIYGGGGDDWLFAGDSALVDAAYQASVGHSYKTGSGGYASFAEALYKNGLLYNTFTNTEVSGVNLAVETAAETNYIDGGDGDDFIAGASGSDTLIGGKGDDFIFAGAGQDIISGGDDDDAIYGDSYATYLNTIDGENYYGPDFIAPGVLPTTGDYSRANFYKDDGSGNAVLRYNANLNNNTDRAAYNALFNDVIDAGEGDDTVYGEIGSDVISGGAGNDFLHGDRDYNSGAYEDGTPETFQKLSYQYHGDDVVDGGTGNDIILGGAGNDILMGGDETVDPNLEPDWGDGTNVNDIICGDIGLNQFDYAASGETPLTGNSAGWWGNDQIYGGKGNDLLVGEGGDDTIYGGDDNDYIGGDWILLAEGAQDATIVNPNKSGADTLYGGAGNDLIKGGGMKDMLDGGSGDDELWGDSGDILNAALQDDDTLIGGTGNDSMYGEGKDDTYIVHAGDGKDFIDDAFGTNTLKIAVGSVEVAHNDGDVVIYTSADHSDNYIQMSEETFSHLNPLQNGSGGTLKVKETFVTESGGIANVSGTASEVVLHNNDVVSGLKFSQALEAQQFHVVFDGSAADVTITKSGGGTIALHVDNWDNLGSVMDANGDEIGFAFDETAARQQFDVVDGVSVATDNFIISGRGGNDVISSSSASEILMGNAGNDTYVMNNGDTDTIMDTEGRNTLKLSGLSSHIKLNTDGVEVYNGNGSSGDPAAVMDSATWNTMTIVNASGNVIAPQVFVFGNSIDSDDNEINYTIDVDVTAGTRTLKLPDGFALSDYTAKHIGNDLLLRSSDASLNTRIVIKDFFNQAPSDLEWKIDESDGAVSLSDWWDSYAENHPDNTPVGIEAALLAFKEDQLAYLEAAGSQGKTLGSIAGNPLNNHFDGNTADNYYNGTPIRSYQFDKTIYQDSTVIDDDVFYTQSSEHVDPRTTTEVHEVRQLVKEYKTVNTPPGIEVVNLGGGYIMYVGTSGVSKTVQTGQHYETKIVENVLYADPIRTFTTYHISGGSEDNTVVAEHEFRGTIDVGNGNNYVDVSGIDSGSIHEGNGAFIQSGSGNDVLMGTGANDVFFAGEGLNYLKGKAGNDTYYVSMSSNSTTYIEDEIDLLGSNNNVVIFPEDIKPEDISYRWLTKTIQTVISDEEVYLDLPVIQLSYDGSNVLIAMGSITTEEGTLYSGVQKLKFSDGTVLEWNNLFGDGRIPVANVLPENESASVPSYYNDLAMNTGSANNDRIIGNLYDNTFSGGDGDDQLYGYAGDDILASDAGDDILDGGVGSDILIGGLGNDTYRIDNTGDIVTENVDEGEDHVDSSVTYTLGSNIENLTLVGSDDIDGEGNALDNVIQGNEGRNILDAGAGDDVLDGGTNDDDLFGGEGNDTLDGGSGNDVLYGGVDDDVLDGGTDGDGLHGNEGNDTLNGGAGYDYLSGGAGDDILDGGADDDELYGDEGNDTLNGGAGYDYLSGGAGDDVLEGGADDDELYGAEGNDTLDGGDGDDTLIAGTGINTYVFGRGYGNDEIDNFKGLNSIRFNADINEDDLIFSRNGNDLYIAITGSDDHLTVFGAFGFDGVENPLDKLIFTDDPEVIQNFSDIRNTIPLITATENYDEIHGTEFNDVIHGLDGDDGLFGNEGDDTLYGDAGEDNLVGGDGDDTLDGGSGNDQADYSSALSGVTVDLSNTSAQDTSGAGIDTLIDIEYLLGSDYNDTLTGDGGDNWLLGGEGNDIVSGGAGNDALYDHGGDDTLNGDAGNDILRGGGGNDTLNGGTGTDTFVFAQGDGVDVISSSDSSDIIQISADPSNVFISRSGNDYLIQYKDDSADSIRIVGTGGVNTINFIDGYGEPAGSWTLDSIVNLAEDNVRTISIAASQSEGQDDYYVTWDKNQLLWNDGLSVEDGWEVVDAKMVDGIEGLFYFGDFYGSEVLAFSIQNAGTATLQYFVQKNGTGPIYAQTIQVNFTDEVDGVVTLAGSSGVDLLDGVDAETTVLDGKAGDDVITGSSGTDTVLYRLGDGNDLINLRDGGAISDTLVLMGNGSTDLEVADVTFSQKGSDLFIHIDDGTEVQTLTVQYYFNPYMGGPVGSIKLFANEAAYTNNTPLTEYTPSGTNNLLVNEVLLQTTAGNDYIKLGTASPNVWEGYINNTLDGMAGNDTLYGADGNDTLIGGSGDDYLVGGSGSDTYQFAVGDGEDAINNYDVNANNDTLAYGETLTDDEDVLEISDVTDYRELWLSFEDVDNNGHDDLVVSFIGNNSDRIVVNDWASDEENQLEKIRVIDSNGTHTLFNTTDSSNDGGLDALVQAMASFGTSPPADGTGWYDGSSLTTEEQTLLTAVNNAWT